MQTMETTFVSRESFVALLGEATQAASDFLRLGSQEVVFVTEGYQEQQARALSRQLPQPDSAVAGAPSLPVWEQDAPNLFHPAVLLQREVAGSRGLSSRQSRAAPAEFDVFERARLVEQHYTKKTWPQQHQHQQPRQQEHTALSLQVTLYRSATQAPAAALPPAAPVAAGTAARAEHQQWRCFTTWAQLAGHYVRRHTCRLEYPFLHLESSDYIVPAQLFDAGLSSWATLQQADPFMILWDGEAWQGKVLGFRMRPAEDRFAASPWRSIRVDYPDAPVNPDQDPDDWCFANPWEMQRIVVSADAAAAAAADEGVPLALAAPSRQLLWAPWTPEGQAARAAAIARLAKRRKSSRMWSEEFDYDYECDIQDEQGCDSDEDFAPALQAALDDEPLEPDFTSHTQLRRQQHRSFSSSNAGLRSAGAGSGAAAAAGAGGGLSSGATGEPAHAIGRELPGVVQGVCLVCRKGLEGGSLVAGHPGKSAHCSRQYHQGCLLLLNGIGIRTVREARQKQQQSSQQQQRRQQQRRQQQRPSAAAAVADGLLLELQQQQQHGHGLPPGLAAAVAVASEAAELLQQGRVQLCCPSHHCHGCGLNGKQENMIWCMDCLIRVYHHRQCVPSSAEVIYIEGKAYIRCPWCSAANTGSAVRGMGPSSAAAAAAEALSSLPAVLEGTGSPAAPAAAIAGVEDVSAAVTAVDMAALHQAGPVASAADAIAADVAGADVAGATGPAEPASLAAAEVAGLAAEGDNEHVMQLADTGAAADDDDDDDDDGGVAAVVSRLPAGQLSQPATATEAATDPTPTTSQTGQAAPGAAAAAAADDCAANDAAAAGSSWQGVLQENAQLRHDNNELQLLVQQLQLQVQHLQEQLQAQQQQKCMTGHCQVDQQQQLMQLPMADAAASQPALAAAAPAATPGSRRNRKQRIGGTSRLGHEQQQAQQHQQQQQLGAIGPASTAATADLGAVAGSSWASELTLLPHSGDAGLLLANPAAGSSSSSSHGNISHALLPTWLLLAAEDPELLQPSFRLVGCSQAAVAALQAAVAASALLSTAVQAAAAYAADAPPLLLAAPQTNWLLGSLSKATNAHKVTQSWGCPVIAVDAPDEGVYGLALVVDHQPGRIRLAAAATATAAAAAAAVPGQGAAAAGQGLLRVRPGLYLRSARSIRQSWQVLVNGMLPDALALLAPGDTLTVQGLSFTVELNE